MIKTVELKENEVCMVLPCNIGDKIIVPRDSISGFSEREGIVQRFEIGPGNIIVKTTQGSFNAREIGNTVFLANEDKQEDMEERV